MSISVDVIINGARRHGEDTGSSSRNPASDAASEATEAYGLANGQVDEYPKSWALERPVVLQALRSFAQTGERPDFVAWHDEA